MKHLTPTQAREHDERKNGIKLPAETKRTASQQLSFESVGLEVNFVFIYAVSKVRNTSHAKRTDGINNNSTEMCGVIARSRMESSK